MISVTRVLSEYYPFDKERVATYIATNRGATKDSIISEWDTSAEKGTIVHKWIEQASFIHFYNHAHNIIMDYRFDPEPTHYISHMECVDLTCKAIHYIHTMHIRPIMTEVTVSKGNLLGIIDMIADIPKHGRAIIDWKTGKMNQSHEKNMDQLVLYSLLYPEAEVAVLVYLGEETEKVCMYRTKDLITRPIANDIKKRYIDI